VYAGRRWDVLTEKERELRHLLDEGTKALPQVALKLGWSYSDLEREGPSASSGSPRRERLEELDAVRVAAEETADLIRTHAGPDAGVYRHFLDALRAAERARNEMINVADMEPEGEWHREASLGLVSHARDNFATHRTAFLNAAHQHIGMGRLRRLLRMVLGRV
jgi:ParB-like chromosome segregation protein Spo0J